DLVVAGVDQVPADRPGQRRAQPWPGAWVAGGGPVQLDLVDLLDAGQQVDVEQPGDSEPDFGLAVAVDIVAFHGHRGAVPDGALDHGGDLRCGGPQSLGVHDN